MPAAVVPAVVDAPGAGRADDAFVLAALPADEWTPCAILRCSSRIGRLADAKRADVGVLGVLRHVAELLHVLLVVVDHLLHVGTIEVGALQTLARRSASRLCRLSRLGRQRDALRRGDLLQLVVRLAVIVGHATAEVLHLRVLRLVLRHLAELHLGHAVAGGGFDEAAFAARQPGLRVGGLRVAGLRGGPAQQRCQRPCPCRSCRPGLRSGVRGRDRRRSAESPATSSSSAAQGRRWRRCHGVPGARSGRRAAGMPDDRKRDRRGGRPRRRA